MSTDGSIDYSNYTLRELYEACGSVNRDRFPRNAQLIDHWIQIREGQVPPDTPPPATPEIAKDCQEDPELSPDSIMSDLTAEEQFPPPKALSFYQVIGDTLTIVSSRKADLLRALVLPYFVIILLGLLHHLIPAEFGTAGRLGISLLSSIAYAMFAVTCHRVILLGNHSTPKFGVLIPSKREFSFWAVTIFLTLGASIAVGALSIPITYVMVLLFDSVHPLVSVAMVGLPLLYLTARMSLVFPSIALDDNHSFRWCWAVTRGNGLSLVALILIPLLPIYLANYIFGESDTLIISCTTLLLGFICTVLGIIFISLSYKELYIDND